MPTVANRQDAATGTIYTSITSFLNQREAERIRPIFKRFAVAAI